MTDKRKTPPQIAVESHKVVDEPMPGRTRAFLAGLDLPVYKGRRYIPTPLKTVPPDQEKDKG